MGDLVEETRALTISPEDEEFGFVARDTNLLEKALNASAKSSLAGSERVAGGEPPEVAPSGTTADVERPRRTVDGEQPDATHAESHRIEERFLEDTTAPKRGILKSVSQQEFQDVYDEPRRIKSYTVSPEEQTAVKKKKMASRSITTGPVQEDLPQVFQVKYLGYQDARGLWGIKHTRRPVDALVAAAKALKVGTVLPLVKLVVSQDGVAMSPVGQKTTNGHVYHTIDTISYGVQDLVYTRVFCMIVVNDSASKSVHPFECHAFVCDSRHSARRLTYSLATAFQEYSKAVSGAQEGGDKVAQIKKRFAIDLRTPEEIEADLKTPQAGETEA